MLGNLTDITETAWGRCRADYGIHGLPQRRHLDADRLLRANPTLRLWFEVVVVSYLVGLPPPIRPESLARPLGPEPLGTCYVAIAHGIDEAVANRSVATHRWLPQADFATWVAEALRVHVFHGCQRSLPTPEPRWVGHAFRANLVLDPLADFVRERPGEPHPRTVHWEHELEITLPGRTAADQLAHAQWHWTTTTHPRSLHDLLLGVGGPTTDIWTDRPYDAVAQIGAHRQLTAMYASLPDDER